MDIKYTGSLVKAIGSNVTSMQPHVAYEGEDRKTTKYATRPESERSVKKKKRKPMSDRSQFRGAGVMTLVG